MPRQLVTILGKSIKKIAKLKGGGSALPGLVIERVDPNFVSDILSQLPMGVVVISGTNGKTATTKIVVELLQSQGIKVFSNKSGSNFVRGVAAALLEEVNLKGKLNADIAVLELDEAHAVHFVNRIKPRYSLILNVMRDQLDRFGEIDKTAKLLESIALATTDTVILNREDELIFNIANSIKDNVRVKFFGLDESLLELFPSDKNLHSSNHQTKIDQPAEVLLKSYDDNNATFLIGSKKIIAKLKINGIYNIFNAAAAILLVKSIVGKNIDYEKLTKSLSNIKPAFGRGETILVNECKVDLILVKNPSGFRLGLKSFDAAKHSTMIAINDNYADGRDMSWLWDIDFKSLSPNIEQVSGSRAFDMTLRLNYDDISVKNTDINIKKALKRFLNTNSKPKRIYCTYTAMMTIRKLLAKVASVEEI